MLYNAASCYTKKHGCIPLLKTLSDSNSQRTYLFGGVSDIALQQDPSIKKNNYTDTALPQPLRTDLRIRNCAFRNRRPPHLYLQLSLPPLHTLLVSTNFHVPTRHPPIPYTQTKRLPQQDLYLRPCRHRHNNCLLSLPHSAAPHPLQHYHH